MIIITAVLFIVLPFVSNLEGFLSDPPITPVEFLESMPFVKMRGEIILIQPSSTLIVYLMGVIIIAVGVYFWITEIYFMLKKELIDKPAKI